MKWREGSLILFLKFYYIRKSDIRNVILKRSNLFTLPNLFLPEGLKLFAISSLNIRRLKNRNQLQRIVDIACAISTLVISVISTLGVNFTLMTVGNISMFHGGNWLLDIAQYFPSKTNLKPHYFPTS